MEETDKLNAICYYLIKQCVETNAEALTITQENVNAYGKAIGDWEIIVKKKL